MVDQAKATTGTAGRVMAACPDSEHGRQWRRSFQEGDLERVRG